MDYPMAGEGISEARRGSHIRASSICGSTNARITGAEKDEFENYVYSERTVILNPKTFNPITWWNNAKAIYPSLHLYAFDTLTIPTMSAECERVFSSTKKLVYP
jgi:hypothetical protein